MSLAGWALLVSCVSLAVAFAALGWQVYSWRRARTMQLEVRFGDIPYHGGDEDWYGIEVVNHSEFPIRVQDVQLVFAWADRPADEPVVIGLRDYRATIPGIVQPHDSGFIATGLPRLQDDRLGVVYANVITAVGDVRSQAYESNHVPPFPAPLRFTDIFPGSAEAPEIY